MAEEPKVDLSKIDLSGKTPDAVQPQPVAVVEIPKTKEDWGKLAKEDPVKFAELTQPRMDAAIREAREAKERLVAIEAREKNLQAELQALKQPVAPVTQPDGKKVYGNGVFPGSEEEWNDLWLENPSKATDLRNEYHAKVNTERQTFEQTRTNARKAVQTEHTDMYLPEIDETGQVKKDDKGKVVLKLDPQSKEPIFNPDSEKGKLWNEIFWEDPNGWNSLKNAPQLMMAEMERRLRVKGSNVIQGQNNQDVIDQSGVAPKGITPPKAITIRFDSDEEEAHAKRAVSRGTYKSLEEYVELKGKQNVGFAEPNRRPDFSKR